MKQEMNRLVQCIECGQLTVNVHSCLCDDCLDEQDMKDAEYIDKMMEEEYQSEMDVRRMLMWPAKW